jgi:serine transporter
VSIVLILGLMFIVRMGQRFDHAGDEHPGLSFIISLIFMALFLIPHWNGAILTPLA